MKRNEGGIRRGFVIVAVFAIVGISLLIATSVIFMVQTQAVSERVSTESIQARAMAKSGIRVVMTQLENQRSAMLKGQALKLEKQYTLYEHDGRTAVVRLLVVGRNGTRWVSESGKVDVNFSTAEGLARTGLMHESMADAILAERDARPGRMFSSINELADVTGVTDEMLHGAIDQRLGELQRAGDMKEEGLQDGGDTPVGDERWADALSIGTAEPVIREDGSPRIEPGAITQEELDRALEKCTNTDAAAKLAELVKKQGLDSRKSLVMMMNEVEIPREDWAGILDLLTPTPGGFEFGKLDVDQAGEVALLSLDGVTAEQARRMVEVRDQLTDAERASMTWPLTSEIMT
ncbi:MAG TPA: hypothetical protein VG711_03430, partial [Phycisphaerales bacterium]|nr:hypothetical protein [Phycisphaerales bacterium]